ncbi:ParM protein [Bacillus phage Hobo]|uniref:Plasmid segregation protein n=2 Tax=Caeruleovirus BM15 TaxID=1985178 RepID=A0A0S2MUT6_9CAUD|nr:partition protein [Bacillus phage BM15]ALO79613.1 plasmid segregation protein [Bacillus phage BM15]AXQ66961.1 ParM protein [Bacillus phage Hobo]
MITNKTIRLNPQPDSLSVAALDDGFGDIKYDYNGSPLLIPSFVIPYKPKPKDDFSTGSKLEYIACEVEGRRYVVGDYAIKMGTNVDWIGGENKHLDKRFPIMFKTALARMARGVQERVYTLMMNLPIKNDTAERRKALTDLVRNTHEISISYDGVEFMPKIITVEDVVIKKQPFGSLCDVMLNNDGEIIDHDVAKGFVVLVDVGARTLNILTVDGLEEQPELTTHTNNGMFQAYTAVSQYLESSHGIMVPDGKLPMIMKSKEIRNMDITDLVNQAYENHANTILNVLDKLLIDSYGFVTTVIFTGGGAELMKPYLEEKYKGTNIRTLFLDRYANARGLRKYGIRSAKKQQKKGINIHVGGNSYNG